MGEADATCVSTLGEVIARMDSLPPEARVFAVRHAGRWVSDSAALVVAEPEGPGLQLSVGGRVFEYFLKVFIAKDVLAGWASYIGGTTVAHEVKVRLLAQYAHYGCSSNRVMSGRPHAIVP